MPRVLETVTRSLWLWGGERLAGETGEERRKFLCQSRLLGRVFSIRWFFFFLTYLLRIFTFPCAFIFYRKAFISNHLYVWLYIVHLYHTVSFNILLPFKWRNSILVSTFFVPTIFFFFLKEREHLFKKNFQSFFKKVLVCFFDCIGPSLASCRIFRCGAQAQWCCRQALSSCGA